jgi:hypothetical protein
MALNARGYLTGSKLHADEPIPSCFHSVLRLPAKAYNCRPFAPPSGDHWIWVCMRSYVLFLLLGLAILTAGADLLVRGVNRRHPSSRLPPSFPETGRAEALAPGNS